MFEFVEAKLKLRDTIYWHPSCDPQLPSNKVYEAIKMDAKHVQLLNITLYILLKCYPNVFSSTRTQSRHPRENMCERSTLETLTWHVSLVDQLYNAHVMHILTRKTWRLLHA